MGLSNCGLERSVVDYRSTMSNRITKSCLICKSPYGKEIRDSYSQGVQGPKLYKKYKEPLEYTATGKSFYQMLWRCKHDDHKLPEPERTSDYTLEEYTRKLMEAGMDNPEMFSGKKISHNAIIAAQRALIEKEKAKVQNDAMKMAMIQFARGSGLRLPEGVVLDGEFIPSDTN